MPSLDLVDTHCHLYFDSFAEERRAVLRRAQAAGVRRIIVPAIDLASCKAVSKLAQQFSSVFAAVGIHPNSVAPLDHEQASHLQTFAQSAQAVAIGEIGLDYFWDKQPRSVQRQAFASQLELAATLDLPVIVHSRDSSDDVLALLEDWAPTLPDSLRDRPGVLHSFSGGPGHAERALALGFYLGFTGPLTFKKSDELRAIAAQAPLDRILVETDAPFLTPHPHRGKRNEPAFVTYVNEQLAQLRGMPPTEMARRTTANAERLFALPPTEIDEGDDG